MASQRRNTAGAASSPGDILRSVIHLVWDKLPFYKRFDFYDFSLLAVVFVLASFGLIMLYSTTAYSAQMSQQNDMVFFAKQAKIDLVCLGMAVGVSMFDYHILFAFRLPLYALGTVLMLLVQTSLGETSHGATRWLNIGGITFQPAEISKIAVILLISCMITRMGKDIRDWRKQLILLGVGALQAGIAWLVTDNLSTALIIAGITFGMIFVASPTWRRFLTIIGLVIGGASIYVMSLANSGLEVTEGMKFRTRRMLVWLNPEKYANNYGFQTIQGLYAIGSGGFFGRGLGKSIQKLGVLPEAQNDMIFSVICEELGLCGAILVMVLFAILLWRLVFIARNAPDLFGTMLVTGVFLHIAIQVVLNIGVVLNLIPNTGVTLPFISYGGTSFLFLTSEIGVCLSVARQIGYQGSLYA